MRTLLSLRLRVHAMLTELLYNQHDLGNSNCEDTIYVFDFRYRWSIMYNTLLKLLAENLYILAVLDSDVIVLPNEDVELVYKKTLRLIWAITYPVYLMSETKWANEQQHQSLEKFKTDFECFLSVNSLVRNLAYSVQLSSGTFFNSYFSELKKKIEEINKNFVELYDLIIKKINNMIDKNIWGSYMKLYSEVLNYFDRQQSLDDFSKPFTNPSLVFPCLIRSLYELPCDLKSIHLKQLHDESVLFNLSKRAACVTADEYTVSSVATNSGKRQQEPNKQYMY